MDNEHYYGNYDAADGYELAAACSFRIQRTAGGARLQERQRRSLLTTAVIAAMILVYDRRIGLILCGGLAVFFAVNSGMMKASAAMARQKIEKDSALVAKVIEYIQGIAEVKAFRLTGQRRRL